MTWMSKLKHIIQKCNLVWDISYNPCPKTRPCSCSIGSMCRTSNIWIMGHNIWARFGAGDMIASMAWFGSVKTHHCHSMFSGWAPPPATSGGGGPLLIYKP